MADVLKMINDLKTRLWDEFGDVLRKENTQEEVHLTYYLSDLLERNGMKHQVKDGETFYTEKATQQAFIAGRRIGLKEAQTIADRIIEDRIEDAITSLKGR